MVKCDICGKALKNHAGLAAHRRLAHALVRPVAANSEQLDRIESTLSEVNKNVKRLLSRPVEEAT